MNVVLSQWSMLSHWNEYKRTLSSFFLFKKSLILIKRMKKIMRGTEEKITIHSLTTTNQHSLIGRTSRTFGIIVSIFGQLQPILYCTADDRISEVTRFPSRVRQFDSFYKFEYIRNYSFVKRCDNVTVDYVHNSCIMEGSFLSSRPIEFLCDFVCQHEFQYVHHTIANTRSSNGS